MNNFSHIWFVNSHSKGHCGYNALKKNAENEIEQLQLLATPLSRDTPCREMTERDQNWKKVGNTV